MSYNTLTTTTLAAAVSLTDTQIQLASATGLSFTSPTLLFCEGEAMTLTQLPNQTAPVATAVGVTRITRKLAHPSGAAVYIGNPSWFRDYDPGGAAVAATEYITPWINIKNGNIWNVVNGVWAIVGNAGITTAGVAAAGVTAVETGNARVHTTVLSFNNLTMAATTNASLGMGVALYTLPAGALFTQGENINVGITGTGTANNASTPVVGLGTTIASGAVSVLSGTAAFQNMMAGQTAANCTGTPTVKTVTTSLVVESGDSHVVYLNVAAAWAGVDAGMKASGTVTIEWTLLA